MIAGCLKQNKTGHLKSTNTRNVVRPRVGFSLKHWGLLVLVLGWNWDYWKPAKKWEGGKAIGSSCRVTLLANVASMGYLRHAAMALRMWNERTSEKQIKKSIGQREVSDTKIIQRTFLQVTQSVCTPPSQNSTLAWNMQVTQRQPVWRSVWRIAWFGLVVGGQRFTC